MNTRYLIDNNALGVIGPRRRASAVFRDYCRVTEDVLYEARDSRRVTGLVERAIPMIPAVLRALMQIMASVAPADKALVDLYANKGAADPVIVATALVLQEQEVESLFPSEWVIVTLDKAVRQKATEFSIATISPQELAAIIDAEHGPVRP